MPRTEVILLKGRQERVARGMARVCSKKAAAKCVADRAADFPCS